MIVMRCCKLAGHILLFEAIFVCMGCLGMYKTSFHLVCPHSIIICEIFHGTWAYEVALFSTFVANGIVAAVFVHGFLGLCRRFLWPIIHLINFFRQSLFHCKTVGNFLRQGGDEIGGRNRHGRLNVYYFILSGVCDFRYSVDLFLIILYIQWLLSVDFKDWRFPFLIQFYC